MRNPRGYWTLERVNKAFDSLKERYGRAPTAEEFRGEYGRAFNIVIKRFGYNRYLEYRGIDPLHKRIKKKDIDDLLKAGPKSYEEISRSLGIGLQAAQHFFTNLRRKKYLRISLCQSSLHHRIKTRDIFSTNSRTFVYLKSPEQEQALPAFFATLIKPELSGDRKHTMTNILRYQLTNSQIEEMWNRYKELEEMGTLLP